MMTSTTNTRSPKKRSFTSLGGGGGGGEDFDNFASGDVGVGVGSPPTHRMRMTTSSLLMEQRQPHHHHHHIDQEQQQQQLSLSSSAMTSGAGGAATALSSSFTTTINNNKYKIELDVIKGELDRERTLRQLDMKRFKQQILKLENQLKISITECKEKDSLLEETTKESDVHIENLKEQRNDIMQQFTETQLILEENENQIYPLKQLVKKQKEQIIKLQNLLDGEKLEIDGLRKLVNPLAKSYTKLTIDYNTQKVNTTTTPQKQLIRSPDDGGGDSDAASSPKSPAPTDILRELNRVRIELANSERKCRQLTRIVQNEYTPLQKEYLLVKTKLESKSLRLGKLENELHTLQKSVDKQTLYNNEWKSFSIQMNKILLKSNNNNNNNMDVDVVTINNNDNDDGATTTTATSTLLPPESTKIIRYLDTIQTRNQTIENEKNVLQRQNDTMKLQVNKLEQTIKDNIIDKEKQQQIICNQKKQIDTLSYNEKTLKSQESIWKHEIDSLQSLIKTYDTTSSSITTLSSPKAAKTPPTTTKTTTTTATTTTPSSKALQTRLTSCQNEIKILKEYRDKTQNDYDTLSNELKEKTQEYNTIKTKFIKLRDALYEERSLKDDAINRANEAELLAGKGSYNEQTTKVLHLQHNPLSDAIINKYKKQIMLLEQQINDLQQQQSSSSSGASPGSSSSKTPAASATATSAATVDAQKYNQRLKESFKEQIGLFREGVYLMTGYKIDMISSGAGSTTDSGGGGPMFKVRSMYADQEDDHLLLKWPTNMNNNKKCSSDDTEITSLDIMETKLAKFLTTTDSYQYMTKFHSLPAFLSSVQLSLFEKQTMM